MANLLKYKRFLAVGCSHGDLADKDAIAAVLKFSREYKPHRRYHLGDVFDMAAFRSKAPGTKDEAVQLDPDIRAGIRFLEQYEPTHLCIGNHDERVWDKSDHQNAIIRKAALACRNEFLDVCGKLGVTTEKGTLIDTYDINESWFEIGDAKILHGFGTGGECAIRDHAEHFGKCIIAHLHRAEIGGGRRSDHPICCCVGTLANVGMLGYAKTRRATARWSYGLAYGEYTDKDCKIWLSYAPQGEAKRWHPRA